jgi:hypothetical protein
MKEKMKAEIAKVKNETQKTFLEKVLEYETKNNIDIEKNPILEGMLPIMLGQQVADATGCVVESEVWYQQYRTMKALLRKEELDIPTKNHQRIEEGVIFLADKLKEKHPEKTIEELQNGIRDMLKSMHIEEAANNAGYDLTSEDKKCVFNEPDEEDITTNEEEGGVTFIDFLEELKKAENKN